jgi:hypothetical protein
VPADETAAAGDKESFLSHALGNPYFKRLRWGI